MKPEMMSKEMEKPAEMKEHMDKKPMMKKKKKMITINKLEDLKKFVANMNMENKK